MECKVKKGIYILDTEALNHLEKQGNQSKYITDLILNDIAANKPITKDEIIKIIDEKLKDCTVNSTDIKDNAQKVNEKTVKMAKSLVNF
jgi:hypothetical protein